MSRRLLAILLFCGASASGSLAFASRLPGDLIIDAPGSDVAVDRRLQAALKDMVADQGATRAVLVVKEGRVVGERYAEGYGPATVFPAYSMTKSLTATVAGILRRDGRLKLDAAPDVPEWRGYRDPRHAIQLADMMHMASGIGSNEDVADPNSDTMTMLFGIGRHNVAHHAAEHPLRYRPGTFFSYSNSTTNVIAGILGRKIGGGERGFRSFVERRLLDPLNIRSAVLGFDSAGTFVGSTYSAMTARDFARLGLLYARGGMSPGGRLIDREWVKFVSTPTAISGGRYGAQFWVGAYNPGTYVAAKLPPGMFCMRGFHGQVIAIVPQQGLVIVILGNVALLKGKDDQGYRDEQIARIWDALR